jgi:hypothetical protein
VQFNFRHLVTEYLCAAELRNHAGFHGVTADYMAEYLLRFLLHPEGFPSR